MSFENDNKREARSPEFRRMARAIEALTVEVNELVHWKCRAQGMLTVVRWIFFVFLAYTVGSCIDKFFFESVKASRPGVAK
jgi:hypothetical protein